MIKVEWELYKNIEKLPSITDPKILKNTNQSLPTEEGLYSEQIFGPKKNNKCQCGAVYSKVNIGEICPECNVECTSNEVRYKRFARIELPPAVYIINPSLKNFLKKLFGATPFKNTISISQYDSNHQDPYYFIIDDMKLIRYSKIKENSKQIIDIPVYDIYSLKLLYDLLLKEYKQKENETNSFHCKVIKLFKECTDNDEMLDYVFLHNIPVTPPETRPLFKLGADKHNVHPVSASYVEILKNKKNSEFDILFENDPLEWGTVVYKYQKSVDLLYEILNEETFQKQRNIMRESITGKTLDYSQRSVIYPDPTLHPNTIALSYDAFHKIYQPFIKEFKFNKYENDESYNVTAYIRYIQNEALSKDGNIYLNNDELKEFMTIYKNKLKSLIERAPVLYSYNTSGYHCSKVLLNDSVNGIKNNQVMGVNTLESKKFNFDFDGDTMAALSITSDEAQKEFALFDSANSKIFEHDGSVIPENEHEAIYAAFMLSRQPHFILESEGSNLNDPEYYESYDDFKPSISTLNKEPHKLVHIGFDEMFYSVAIFNKACNIGKTLVTNECVLDKKRLKQVVREIYDYDEDLFYDNLHNFNKFLLECSSTVGYCSPTFDSKDFDIYNDDIVKFKKTLINEPYLGFHQNDTLFNDFVLPEVEKNNRNILHLVSISGARIKSVQLLKAASNNGIPTDINGKGKAINAPQSLLEGKTPSEFYIESDSARLALAQRQDAIPKGGELQRKFYYQYGYLKQSFEDDCGCNDGLYISIQNKTHLKSLEGRYYKDSLSDEKWKLIIPRKKEMIGKEIILRSAIHCKSKDYKVCKKCLGELRPNSENLGTKIGAYVSESIIQSVLRTHHFSGAFITEIKSELKTIMNKLEFQSPNYIKYTDINDLKELEKFMIDNYYQSDDFEFQKVSNKKVKLIVHNLPYNDDAVKLLTNIISIIDVNREGDNILSIEEMYYKLCDNIIFPNGIYSYLIELIISMMYYDEDGILLRYSDKPAYKQIAIKNIISSLDPRLTIFYKLTNNAIYNILTSDKFETVDHMYYDLLRHYK